MQKRKKKRRSAVQSLHNFPAPLFSLHRLYNSSFGYMYIQISGVSPSSLTVEPGGNPEDRFSHVTAQNKCKPEASVLAE